MVGRTSARNACSSTLDARNHLHSPSIGRSCPAPRRVPDLSHFLGCEPRWFCRNTLSPSDRGASDRACMSRASVERAILLRMASSFWDHASRHVGRIDGLLYLMHRLVKEKASRMGLPNTTCAGDILQSGSGVLRAWSNARRRPSLFRDPVGPTLSISMRFAFLTATSARPLTGGNTQRTCDDGLPIWLESRQ